ncbi:MAG: DUF2652 domain-containing protein [Acidimicrobiia bacterium]|nr:DUF2652 domain-containing protein [Acidimicrobiia bacterium]
MLPTAQPTCFLIADISGYTRYLARVELEHSIDVLTDLLDVIVSALRPNFRLSRVEGDAAFMFAQGESLDGSMLLDTIEGCYFGFRRRRRDIVQSTSCPCNACLRIPDLDLKFIVHHGPALIQEVAGRQELLGVDAIVVHRLGKNQVVERFGVGAYALISAACMDAAELDPAPLGMLEHSETYDEIGEVPVWVHDMERRWQEEEERVRVRVAPGETILDLSADTTVAPQTAWEFLTKPGQRMSWQPWVTSVEIKGATGGRRGLGSANHCMHGEDAVVEEILDWRPYDYVTDMTILDTPDGPVKVPHTIEFEPTATGTTIHFRFGPPETPGEAAAMEVIGPAYGAALAAAIPDLIAQMEEEFAAADSDRGPEPEITVPG